MDDVAGRGTVEIRVVVERELADVFDARSIGKNMTRNELIVSVLSAKASKWKHAATLIHRVTRGNPQTTEDDGKDRM